MNYLGVGKPSARKFTLPCAVIRIILWYGLDLASYDMFCLLEVL